MIRTVVTRLLLVGALVMVAIAGGTVGVVAADDTGTGDCDDTEREPTPACSRDDTRPTSGDVVERVESTVGETPNGDKIIRILKKKLPS